MLRSICFHCSRRNIQDLADFFVSQATEEAQLDDLALAGIEAGQVAQGVVDRGVDRGLVGDIDDAGDRLAAAFANRGDQLRELVGAARQHGDPGAARGQCELLGQAALERLRILA